MLQSSWLPAEKYRYRNSMFSLATPYRGVQTPYLCLHVFWQSLQFPSAFRLYWMKTRFHISITCGWPVLTSRAPSFCFRSSSLLKSTWISEQGHRGLYHPFPEVIFFTSLKNSMLIYPLFPKTKRYFIFSKVLSLVTFKNSYIYPAFIDLNYISQKFPCPFDGLFLKIIAKRPVPNISNMVWWYVSCPTSSRSLCFPDTLRHFWVLAILVYTAARFSRKISLNWFIRHS